MAETNNNARGAFTFSGFYSSQGAQTSLNTGADFADFLLGLPQQATLQVGGTTTLRENAWDVYVDDNWQKSAKMTLSLGLRYEVTLPYVEASGSMANLDVTPDFTAASVVTPGQTGPYTGILSGRARQHRLEQRQPAIRHRVPAGAQHDPARRLQPRRTTRARTRRSRASSSASRRLRPRSPTSDRSTTR